MSMPPTTTAVRIPSGPPSTANWSEIWNASSLQCRVEMSGCKGGCGGWRWGVPRGGEDEREDAVRVEGEVLEDGQREAAVAVDVE